MMIVLIYSFADLMALSPAQSVVHCFAHMSLMHAEIGAVEDSHEMARKRRRGSFTDDL